MNSTRLAAQSGDPTFPQYRTIWQGYTYPNGTAKTGCLIPGYFNTTATCLAAGGTPHFNLSVADIVPYPVYFCQVDNGNLLLRVRSAYDHSYGMILVACNGVVDATLPKQSGVSTPARLPGVLVWAILFSSLAWLASVSS